MIESKGLELRDYDSAPLGKNLEVCSVTPIPKSEWRDRIADHETNKTRPLDIHLQNAVPILNQKSLKYCWVFSCVAGIQNRLAYMGIDPVPELSAACVGSIFKKGRNVGGYAEQGARACLNGVPDASYWANSKLKNAGFDFDNSDAHKNVLAKFTELRPYAIGDAMSVLLSDDPKPIVFALPWWRHAVCILAACYQDKQFGFHYVNSYGSKWGNQGFGTILGDKTKAHEMIVCDSILARAES